MDTKELLKRLIAFATVSSESNLELIDFVQSLLATKGIQSELVFNDDHTKAAMFASIGPAGQPGLLLSGHSDVVPVKGQNWQTDPFTGTEQDGKIYGRGSCDMKGFIASAIQIMLAFADKPLSRPVHLAISYDEELGCLGVKDLLLQLQHLKVEPYLCIVGEPTSMNIATGHKGKTSFRTHCCGDEAHSSQAPLHTNAIYLACDIIAHLRQLQTELITSGARDEAYNIPHSTVHVGTIEGGRSLNIVPGECQFVFEIRHLPGDDIDTHLEALFAQAETIVQQARQAHPTTSAAITFDCLTRYPGLDTPAEHPAVQQLSALSPAGTETLKVAFGSEGGLFAEYLSAPVVVCGPGSIDQAHKPNEFISLSQLQQCDDLLNKLVPEICFQPE
ncbi:acetylornithine deacetylase [Vibrio quintilis]|uniref:Acetylornithine deacetylase n=1 Tax=Vibrio quintilis TaxID=1117707 RepID=A0A1M7YTP6_9VIBR|nr:acetylornithine deacetylase [Vibrio quintilis]SHO55979.1 Acetylornithine deacetylase [Vibrio quintilis]